MNPFVTQAALEAVDRVAESEPSIVLTQRESIWLLELLANPPERNEKFLQAQNRYQRMKADADANSQ
jgi:uncharacterized protein (DUF1778 family)